MSIHVRVKICGITNEADALHAAALGADAIGLNFYPQSPRSITPQNAGYVLRALPPFVEPVAVFVNQPLSAVFPLVQQLGRIHTIQMHGDQREMCDSYPYHFVPAFQVRDKTSLEPIRRYLDACRNLGRLPSAILVDGYAPDQHGGTGRNPPWGLLGDTHWDVPLILAGGLTPENVAEAVRVVRPYAVDVASGVESTPGHKDPEKVERFIEQVREAGG
jgi:phosphoribosylanthranilate isomerase